jgi:hypothetical protein
MRCPLPDLLYRTQSTRKHLPLAGDFYSWFDDVADPRHAHFLAWIDHAQRDVFDAAILRDKLHQGSLIHFQRSALILKLPAQANLFHREIGKI